MIRRFITAVVTGIILVLAFTLLAPILTEMFGGNFRSVPDPVPLIGVVFFIAVLYGLFGGIAGRLFRAIRLPRFSKEKPKEFGRSNAYSFFLDPVHITNPFRGIAVVGSAGSGKSRSVAVPVVRQMMEKAYSGFLYDYKYPELTREVLASENARADIYTVNFVNPKESYRINPLHPDYIENSSYADEFARTILRNLMPGSANKQDFWSRSAQSILTATIWYLRDEHPEYCTLPHAMNLLNRDEETLVDVLGRNLQSKQMISSLESAVKKEAHGQVAGMLSTAQTSINKINTPPICWILSGNDFSLDLNDPDAPKFLNIGTRPEVADTYAPLNSLIISVALKQMNQPGKHHSIAILDEAPTLYIPNIDRIPATGRSHKVATMFMCQDLAQVRDMYGKDKAESILGNLNNQFWGRASSKNTARYISDLFGKEERWFESVSESEGESDQGGLFSPVTRSENVSRSWSVQQRKVIREQDPLNREPGEFYSIIVELEGESPFYNLGLPEPPDREETPEPATQYDVTGEEMKDHFHRIHDEVTEIIKGSRSKDKNSDTVREI